jgi:hypothetical protein
MELFIVQWYYTNHTERSRFREADTWVAGEELPTLYGIRRTSRSQVPYPVHTNKFYLCKIHFDIIYSPTSWSSNL